MRNTAKKQRGRDVFLSFSLFASTAIPQTQRQRQRIDDQLRIRIMEMQWMR